MTKRIALDDDTYVILKSVAQANGRTIVGQLRYTFKDSSILPASSASSASQVTANNGGHKMYIEKPKTEAQLKIQELAKKLDELDEGSDEYLDVLDEIAKLQKTY